MPGALLIGSSGVGKTELQKALAGEDFSSSYMTTIGSAFKKVTCEIDSEAVDASEAKHVPTQSIEVQVFDTPGQERFRDVTQAYFRGRELVIFVVDPTQQWEEQEQYFESLLNNSINDLAEDTKFLMVITKHDQPPAKLKAWFTEPENLFRDGEPASFVKRYQVRWANDEDANGGIQAIVTAANTRNKDGMSDLRKKIGTTIEAIRAGRSMSESRKISTVVDVVATTCMPSAKKILKPLLVGFFVVATPCLSGYVATHIASTNPEELFKMGELAITIDIAIGVAIGLLIVLGVLAYCYYSAKKEESKQGKVIGGPNKESIDVQSCKVLADGRTLKPIGQSNEPVSQKSDGSPIKLDTLRVT